MNTAKKLFTRRSSGQYLNQNRRSNTSRPWPNASDFHLPSRASLAAIIKAASGGDKRPVEKCASHHRLSLGTSVQDLLPRTHLTPTDAPEPLPRVPQVVEVSKLLVTAAVEENKRDLGVEVAMLVHHGQYAKGTRRGFHGARAEAVNARSRVPAHPSKPDVFATEATVQATVQATTPFEDDARVRRIANAVYGSPHTSDYPAQPGKRSSWLHVKRQSGEAILPPHPISNRDSASAPHWRIDVSNTIDLFKTAGEAERAKAYRRDAPVFMYGFGRPDVVRSSVYAGRDLSNGGFTSHFNGSAHQHGSANEWNRSTVDLLQPFHAQRSTDALLGGARESIDGIARQKKGFHEFVDAFRLPRLTEAKLTVLNLQNEPTGVSSFMHRIMEWRQEVPADALPIGARRAR